MPGALLECLLTLCRWKNRIRRVFRSLEHGLWPCGVLYSSIIGWSLSADITTSMRWRFCRRPQTLNTKWFWPLPKHSSKKGPRYRQIGAVIRFSDMRGTEPIRLALMANERNLSVSTVKHYTTRIQMNNVSLRNENVGLDSFKRGIVNGEFGHSKMRAKIFSTKSDGIRMILFSFRPYRILISWASQHSWPRTMPQTRNIGTCNFITIFSTVDPLSLRAKGNE